MGKTVLLIEDEPNIIEAISFILSRDGWTVTSHSDGRDAVEVIRREQPAVVVLDMMLPGRSGLEILADMRADAGLVDIPVLILTAKGQVREREAAERAGASRFMTKPFSNADVLASVRELGGVAS